MRLEIPSKSYQTIAEAIAEHGAVTKAVSYKDILNQPVRVYKLADGTILESDLDGSLISDISINALIELDYE